MGGAGQRGGSRRWTTFLPWVTLVIIALDSILHAAMWFGSGLPVQATLITVVAILALFVVAMDVRRYLRLRRLG